MITITALDRALSDNNQTWIATHALPRGSGSLEAKNGTHGGWFYYSYRDRTGKRDRIPLGPYRRRGENGLSLADAVAKAQELANIYRYTTRNVRAYITIQQQERDAELQQKAEPIQTATVGDLIKARIQHLQRQHKDSKPVKSALYNAFADYWDKPAECLTRQDITHAINAILARGKRTLAERVRSYIKTAYNEALNRENPGMDLYAAFVNVSENPAERMGRVTPTIARDRVLTRNELIGYIRWLNECKIYPVARAALLCHLYLGGQRFRQLIELKKEDIDWDRKMLTIFDRKGRRSIPRRHPLPMTDKVAGFLLEAKPFWNSNNVWAFPSVRGSGHILSESLGKTISQGNTNNWQPRDLRRTVETEMVRELRVSIDVRAHLLSHGLSGVQHVHYDRHDYFEEMRTVLLEWGVFLDSLGTV